MSFNRIMGCSLVGIIVLAVASVGLRSALDKADAAPVAAPQMPPSFVMPPKPGQSMYKDAGSFVAGGKNVYVTEDFLHHKTCYTTNNAISCVPGVR